MPCPQETNVLHHCQCRSPTRFYGWNPTGILSSESDGYRWSLTEILLSEYERKFAVGIQWPHTKIYYVFGPDSLKNWPHLRCESRPRICTESVAVPCIEYDDALGQHSGCVVHSRQRDDSTTSMCVRHGAGGLGGVLVRSNTDALLCMSASGTAYCGRSLATRPNAVATEKPSSEQHLM